MEPTTITKLYKDFPCGHRQHLHDGHCRWLHGHNLDFEFTFGCEKKDEIGFVFDFGKLKEVKAFLEDTFDHTFLISSSDPEAMNLVELGDLLKPVVMPDTSCEGIAKYTFEKVNEIIRQISNDRAFLVCVTVWEDSKNSATYQP